MENEEVKMDPQLKLAIKRFIIQEVSENYSGHAQDLTNGLEAHLSELGFDLECVNQYKSKMKK